MRIAALRWLRCPAPDCRQSLVLSQEFSPVWSKTSNLDLQEGILECPVCASRHPVMLGVAVLVPEQQHYLWACWDDIQRCAQGLPGGAGISQAMRSYLAVPGTHIGRAEPSGPTEEDLDWTVSPYLQSHYDRDSLTDQIPGGWLSDAVAGSLAGSHNPYSYLTAASRDLAGAGGGLAVEVGTGIGHTLAQLAAGRDFAIGVDWSFRAILTARRHLLREPDPLESYRLEGERGELTERPLAPVPGPANLEFVVADAAALPFAAGASRCLAALNLLCAVPAPRQVLPEIARIIAPGGQLLLSTPYWSDSPSEAVFTGPQDLRRALEPDFELAAEDDAVPWLLRLAKRRFNIYLCDCLIGVRRS